MRDDIGVGMLCFMLGILATAGVDAVVSRRADPVTISTTIQIDKKPTEWDVVYNHARNECWSSLTDLKTGERVGLMGKN